METTFPPEVARRMEMLDLWELLLRGRSTGGRVFLPLGPFYGFWLLL